MTPLPRTNLPPLPLWVILGGSALIVFHFLALGALVLAPPSGPWPMSFGASPALGPPFAVAVHGFTGPHYLFPLHMENDYHFSSNVPGMPTVFFEVHLKDKNGKLLRTLKFPDDHANAWVRQRQRLLAEGLGNDQPYQLPQGEKVYPPGQGGPKIQLWLGGEGNTPLKLKEMAEKDVPRNRPLSRPSEWSLLLAKAFARHLCREHGAASAELVRHSRNALVPDLLFVPGPLPADAFNELVCNYGDLQ